MATAQHRLGGDVRRIGTADRLRDAIVVAAAVGIAAATAQLIQTSLVDAASAGVIPRKSSFGMNTQSSPAVLEPSAVLASRCRSRSARAVIGSDE